MSKKKQSDFEFLKHIHLLARAAVPFVDERHLYQKQRDAARRIIGGVKAIAMESYAARFPSQGELTDDPWDGEALFGQRKTPETYRRNRQGAAEEEESQARWRSISARHSRPHNCYVVNGGRGSGKTTLLNNLVLRLTNLTFPRKGTSLRHDVTANRSLKVSAKEQYAALVLRIPMPNDLDVHEAPMEAVFAAVHDRMLWEQKEAREDTEFSRNLKTALDELRKQVLVGWTFSHGDGVQSLVNDALDFHDFAKNRAECSLHAHMRIEAWLGFIDTLLNTLGHELLVLVFDDMDLHPNAGQRIVEDIRQYMVHPRIVTIVATDLERMVDGMIRHSLTDNPNLTRVLEAIDNDQQRREKAQRTVYLPSFVHDCSHIALAKMDKVFPPSMRYNLELSDRVQLDALLDCSFTEICVTHFFAHYDLYKQLESPQAPKNVGSTVNMGEIAQAPLVATAKPGESPGEMPDSATKVQKEALAWWFLNAPHSALVTDTVRSYVQFLHGLFHDVLIEEGSEVSLPCTAHKPVQEVLLSYHKARDIRRLHSNSSSLFEVALRQGGGRWNWDQSYQRNAPIDSFIEHLTDFWLDIKIASSKLDCQKLPSLRRWLPLELMIPLEKTGKDLLPTPRIGINGYFPDRVLPRSCLYVYQLRYLDMLVPFMRNDLVAVEGRSLFNHKSEPSDNVRLDLRAVDHFLNRLAEIRDRVIKGVLTKPITEVASDERYSETKVLYDEEESLAHHIILFSLLRPTEGGRLLSGLRAFLAEYQDIDDIELADIQYCPPAEKDDLALFNVYRSAWAMIEPIDQGRDFFRTVWILAVHLGRLGNDYGTIRVPDITPDLGISFRTDEPGRLLRLAQETKAIIDTRSPRTAILLAWSLRPVVEPMLSMGCDQDGDPDADKAWGLVRSALMLALDMLDGLLSSGAGTGATATPASGTDPENAPEQFVPAARSRDWHFVDFTDFQLQVVRSDIQKSIEAIDKGTKQIKTPTDLNVPAEGQNFIHALEHLAGISLQSAIDIHMRLNVGMTNAQRHPV